MKKLVDIKELRTLPSSVYDTHYQKYCTMQWDWPLEESFYVEGLMEQHKWLVVDNLHYNVSYSQGDYAYFTGRVDLNKFLDEFDTEGEYFVLREALKLQDVDGYLRIGSNRQGGRYEDFGIVEWIGPDNWGDETVVRPYGGYNSILTGMNYGDYYATCEEMMGDLETWVKEKCRQLFRKLYDDIRSEIDYQMSEEAFEDWAAGNDIEFEVEIDDEGDTEETTPKCGGAVSPDETSRLAA